MTRRKGQRSGRGCWAPGPSYPTGRSLSPLVSLKVWVSGCSWDLLFSESRRFHKMHFPRTNYQNRLRMPAFRACDFVSRLPIRQSWGANCRKSPAMSANTPRFAETRRGRRSETVASNGSSYSLQFGGNVPQSVSRDDRRAARGFRRAGPRRL